MAPARVGAGKRCRRASAGHASAAVAAPPLHVASTLKSPSPAPPQLLLSLQLRRPPCRPALPFSPACLACLCCAAAAQLPPCLPVLPACQPHTWLVYHASAHHLLIDPLVDAPLLSLISASAFLLPPVPSSLFCPAAASHHMPLPVVMHIGRCTCPSCTHHRHSLSTDFTSWL